MPADTFQQLSATSPACWWKHGVIYHLYPRSFFDSNGDGIGDLRGIIRSVNYLVSLGVDAIWLSPIFTSPNFDFGYDVSDFRGVNPEYGTMDDFQELLRVCHENNIRVILDMILNHTSHLHPWFVEARSSVYNTRRDWYVWKEGIGKKPPNNWKAAVGGSAWELNTATNRYYLHSFFKEQPDLNWRNTLLAEEFFNIWRYWLDMGVDGFRLDVINMIIKDKKFRNNPAVRGLPFFQTPMYNRNRPKSIKIVRRLRKLLNEYPERVAIGEIYAMPPGEPERAASYLAGGDKGLHLAFDFSLVFATWNARKYYRAIAKWNSSIPEQGWPCNVLSNHDLFRSFNRRFWIRHKKEKAQVSAFLLLTLKGTPVVYYGEEIGMKNSNIRRRDLQDPLGKKYWPWFKGRDKARTPMQWTSGMNGGFSSGTPWLPLNPDYQQVNVTLQEQDPNSLLNLYKALIRLRKLHPALQQGDWIPVCRGDNNLLSYLRKTETETLLVILNFNGKRKKLILPAAFRGTVLLSNQRTPDDWFAGSEIRVGPFETSLFRIT